MIDILLTHWATYVYLVQLLVLLIAILRSGLGQAPVPGIMPVSWERIAAHFAWPLRPSPWQWQGQRLRPKEAIQLTFAEGPVPADAVLRLEANHDG